jgi:hypothetical protein
MKNHHLLYDVDELPCRFEDGSERPVEALVDSGWIARILYIDAQIESNALINREELVMGVCGDIAYFLNRSDERSSV